MESTLMSIQYWDKWYVTCFPILGQIFVCAWIHPFGVDVSSLLGGAYSQYDPAYPNPVNSMSSIVIKYCPREIFFMKPASSLALLTRTCSARYSNLMLWRRNRSPCTGRRLIWNLLSEFFAPFRYCSVDTELINGIAHAKQQLCCCRITVAVNG